MASWRRKQGRGVSSGPVGFPAGRHSVRERAMANEKAARRYLRAAFQSMESDDKPGSVPLAGRRSFL